jgi:small-conductance mechanosensitive channel
MTMIDVFDKLKEFLELTLFSSEKTTIDIRTILFLLILFIVTRIVLNFNKHFFKRRTPENTSTRSQNYILRKFTHYVIVVAALLIGLNSVGLELTFFLAGSAALFVGIGLGIQDVFKDVIAGFILLFGKAINVGDVIEVENIVGRVTDIDFRVSTIVTRDDIDMLIPNSMLISDKLINWSYNNELTRSSLAVSVAYGSDTDLVKRILLNEANKHPDIVKEEKQPFVRFADFGNSSLDFQLFFWSENIFRIENTLSDLRFAIDSAFRKNNVTIPFPQRDVHIKES